MVAVRYLDVEQTPQAFAGTTRGAGTRTARWHAVPSAQMDPVRGKTHRAGPSSAPIAKRIKFLNSLGQCGHPWRFGRRERRPGVVRGTPSLAR